MESLETAEKAPTQFLIRTFKNVFSAEVFFLLN